MFRHRSSNCNCKSNSYCYCKFSGDLFRWICNTDCEWSYNIFLEQRSDHEPDHSFTNYEHFLHRNRNGRIGMFGYCSSNGKCKSNSDCYCKFSGDLFRWICNTDSEWCYNIFLEHWSNDEPYHSFSDQQYVLHRNRNRCIGMFRHCSSNCECKSNTHHHRKLGSDLFGTISDVDCLRRNFLFLEHRFNL